MSCQNQFLVANAPVPVRHRLPGNRRVIDDDFILGRVKVTDQLLVIQLAPIVGVIVIVGRPVSHIRRNARQFNQGAVIILTRASPIDIYPAIGAVGKEKNFISITAVSLDVGDNGRKIGTADIANVVNCVTIRILENNCVIPGVIFNRVGI